MAINWGSAVGDYGRIGLNITTSNISETITRVTTEVWFWSKYSVSDNNNALYFDYGTTTATTSKGSVSIKTTSDSGGWSTTNQIKLATYTYDYARTTNNQTGYCSAKLANIEVVGGAMSVSGSFPVPARPMYTITYNANGGSGAPDSQSYVYAPSGVTYLSGIKPTRTGYTFLGWSLSSTATTPSYSAGQAWGLNNAGNYTLYAVWKLNTYTITYNTNGGSTASWTETKNYGSRYLSSTVPVRTNYAFLGWSTSAGATSATYTAGGVYYVSSNVTLYAVWELVYTKPRITELSVYRCYDTYASVNFNWACDNPVTSITISWTSTSSGSGSESVIATGTSGKITNKIIGGTLSTDSTYTITVEVKDTESTTRSLTLNGSMFPIDVFREGKGIAFGKPAETEGLFEVAFDTRFNKPVKDGIITEHIVDATRPGTRYSASNDQNESAFEAWLDAHLSSMPNQSSKPINFSCSPAISGATFSGTLYKTTNDWAVLEANSYSMSGKAYKIKYNGTWNKTSLGPKVLWEGALYPGASNYAYFSELVSQQANGIVLGFSRFYPDSNTTEDGQIVEHFVSKYSVNKFQAKGHSFNLCSIWGNGTKYIYIDEGYLYGHAYNTQTITVGGITYTNSNYVLRYVLGV